MVMIPINHAAPLLLSPDNVGPGMTLNCDIIKLKMVMILINHATPFYCMTLNCYVIKLTMGRT